MRRPAEGQQLGYSPLPRNLVEFGFEAMRGIPGAPAPPPIEQCSNPTITGNFTENLENAPPPPASARQGAVAGDAANPAAPGTPAAAGSPAAVAAAAKKAAAATKAGGAAAQAGGAAAAGDAAGGAALPGGGRGRRGCLQ
ncbi:MAG: hypothetical protein ABIS21_07680 [Acidimicrobiales bacterium]